MIAHCFLLSLFISFTKATINENSTSLQNHPSNGALNIHQCYLRIRVAIEFFEKSHNEHYTHRKTIQSSEYFRSRFNSVKRTLAASQQTANSDASENSSSQNSQSSDEGSVSGSYGGFSAEASFQMSSMFASTSKQASSQASSQGTENSESHGVSSQEVDRHTSESFNEIEERDGFQDGLLQIYRLETTTLTIDGESATIKDMQYVDSEPTDSHNTPEQLKERAEKEIKYYYPTDNPRGRNRRNTYEECGCKTCQECNICELKDDLDEVEKINRKIDHYLPIGTIIPWVNRPHLNSDRTKSEIPDGWQRCDGSTIPAPSPWAGEMTPNINGEKRFLRGGSDGDQLITEEDSLQEHTHQVRDPGHEHGYDDKYPAWINRNGRAGFKDFNEIETAWDKSHQRGTNLANSNIRVTNVNGARTSGETRPKNIRVVYIMKVF